MGRHVRPILTTARAPAQAPSCGATHSVVEPVAHAAHGGDRRRTELLAQVADVDVHNVRAGVEVEAPDLVEELLAREDLAGVHHERLRQRELACRQLELALADGRATGADVEADTAGLEDVVATRPTLLGSCAKPEPDTGQQLG